MKGEGLSFFHAFSARGINSVSGLPDLTKMPQHLIDLLVFCFLFCVLLHIDLKKKETIFCVVEFYKALPAIS